MTCIFMRRGKLGHTERRTPCKDIFNGSSGKEETFGLGMKG